MAVSNNLGMYLPTRDDYISVKRDISDNLALIDAAAGNMDIIVNGNTASVNVTSGQFVTVLNSTITGVTDGIYKAVANVAAGVPFVAANLTSPTSGALNELVEQIAWKYLGSTSTSSGVAINLPSKFNEICCIGSASAGMEWDRIMTIPAAFLDSTTRYFYVGNYASNNSGASFNISATKTQVTITGLWEDGSAKTGYMNVYYR